MQKVDIVQYLLLKPTEPIPYNLREIISCIPENEHKLQSQVYDEQGYINKVPKKFSIKEWTNKRITQKIIYYIAYNEDKLVGSISFFLNPQSPNLYYDYDAKDAYHISQIYVDSDHRGIGIGKQLMLLAENCVKQTGYKKIDLKTSYSNFKAQSMYNELGYKVKFASLSLDITKYDITKVTPLKLLYHLDNNMNQLIINDLVERQSYYNNGFSLKDLKNNLITKLENRSFGIFYNQSCDTYCLWCISTNSIYNSLTIFSIFGDVRSMLDSLAKYISVKDIYTITITVSSNDIDKYLYYGFEGKMLHLVKFL